MARPAIKARKIQHGDKAGGLPGQPEIVSHGTGGGGGAGGAKKIKGPGANAKIKSSIGK